MATPALPTSPMAHGVVGVPPHQGGHVERRRQAGARPSPGAGGSAGWCPPPSRSRRTCASSTASPGTWRRTGPGCRGTRRDRGRRRRRDRPGCPTGSRTALGTSSVGVTVPVFPAVEKLVYLVWERPSVDGAALAVPLPRRPRPRRCWPSARTAFPCTSTTTRPRSPDRPRPPATSCPCGLRCPCSSTPTTVGRPTRRCWPTSASDGPGYLVSEALWSEYGDNGRRGPRDWADGERSPGITTFSLVHRNPASTSAPSGSSGTATSRRCPRRSSPAGATSATPWSTR